MKTIPTKPAQHRQCICMGTWMFTAQLILTQVSYRCICLALANLGTAAFKKSPKTHTDRKRLTIMLANSLNCTTCSRQQHNSRWTWTSPAQLIVPQSFLLLHSMTCTTLRRNTCSNPKHTTRRTWTSSAQLILSQVSCRCKCLAEVL